VANLIESYGESKVKELAGLIPKEQDAKMYVYLVTDQILGRDKRGELRPYGDLAMLLYQAKRTGLDPIAKQIYGVYRWDSNLGREKMTIQVGIDGLRAIAQRTGMYAGSDEAVYEEKDGKPLKATVSVNKILPQGGQIVKTTASARWSEYSQTYKTKDGTKLMGMWGKMPYLMLGKCAEALALRKAFPAETSGLYIHEEISENKSKIDELKLPEPKKAEDKKELPKPKKAKTAGDLKIDKNVLKKLEGKKDEN